MPVKIAFSKQFEVDGVVAFRQFASLPFHLRFYGRDTYIYAIKMAALGQLNSESARSECVIKTTYSHTRASSPSAYILILPS